jgi:hypothetical protein
MNKQNMEQNMEQNIVEPLEQQNIVEPLEQQYLNQLSQHELNAYLIAKNHLGTSFNLKKSNGYELWYKNLKPV